MASAVPIEMIDDDDDFDWEAAIKEIDVACDEATKRSSSAATTTAAATTTTTTIFRNSSVHTGSCPKIENSKPASSRQSTLDRFIGLTGSKSANQDARHDAEDTTECNDETVSSVNIDPEAAKTWLYPENVPVRDYQLAITRTALFSNTLVSLPTGLGKTLIAAVVMYNYFRWFPEGKIVFAAPSRPLVLQQIEACHNIVGIPQEYTVEITGQTNPQKRAFFWKTKRVFFLTPQVLENDIRSGSCLMKQIVCLVLDEAHHASKNHAYCVAFRELMAASVQFRLLALTATPGSDHEAVQKVIDTLQISSLEHRNETDADVAPYVHDRKIDVIQVEMGKDALEVRDLLMIVISRYVKKLSAFGVSLKRDIHSLGPHYFFEAREKFREAPPQNLPEIKYREIEGFYGVLITLYHIRKQLLEHGIGPAYKMLEEKLAQGILACHLSRDETIWKAKLMMKQYVDHGVRSPKFTKMLEVLVEHFKRQDPQQSRVIIFSNFRESVRGIMISLATIGEYVKATEFIGQNSGKSKGQSQKVQQAILKKFRAGEFNVIVATSIGEEGLDIMEVDLVICFDANVSPLRMIQRMGRTGRKNKGRVACEGSEISGYKNKQSKSKAIKKHMLNGGTNSFGFHPSPRMVPHIFRPEKVLVKFSIEGYVHRGKKVKEDDAIQTPKYKQKLNNNENELLEKYFYSSSENNWRPSLIAFPHFQAYPSRIHQVSHSLRTMMLIDTMQDLQGLSFNHQDEETSDGCFRVENLDHHDSNTREDDPIQKEPEFKTEEKHNCPSIHSFLFGSDFTSIDSLGRVLILSVPIFPLKPKISSPQNRDFSPVKDLHEGYNGVFTTTPIRSQGADESTNLKAAADLSPRLTNLLMSGVVPESPIDNGSSKPKDYNMTPGHKNEIDLLNNSLETNCVSGSKFVGKTRTPLAKLSNNSCSEDWILESGEKSISQPKPRLKRLRRYNGFDESENLLDDQEIMGRRSCARLDHGRGDKKLLNDARVFIEDEAEVSSEGSGDEDVNHGQDSYGGSFIDDRINPTVANTQAECDMMAIYRRSLLTQSPLITTPHGGGSSSISLNTERLCTSDAGTSTTTATGIPSTTTAGFLKRKLSYFQDGSLPIRNLETEVFSEHPAKEPPWKTEEAAAMDEFDNDEFYEGIDFDALEEQAAQQLRSKSQVSSGKMNEKPNNRDLDFLGSPSFDLGI